MEEKKMEEKPVKKNCVNLMPVITEARSILRNLGCGRIPMNDETMIGDVVRPSLYTADYPEKCVKTAEKRLGIKISLTDYVWEVAKQLKEHEQKKSA